MSNANRIGKYVQHETFTISFSSGENVLHKCITRVSEVADDLFPNQTGGGGGQDAL